MIHRFLANAPATTADVFILTLAVGAVIFAFGMWAAITSRNEPSARLIQPNLLGGEAAVLAAVLNRKAAEIWKEYATTGQSILEIARSKNLLSEKEIAEILHHVTMIKPQNPKDAGKRDEVSGK